MKKVSTALVPVKSGQVSAGFDYSVLDEKLAEQAKAAAKTIRETLKTTIEGIFQVGDELNKMKKLLGHGSFGAWLRAEFDLSERHLQNFMGAAERFEGKTEIIADLMQPTAVYLLAAPSVPEQARKKAIAEAKKKKEGLFTAKDAKEVVDRFKLPAKKPKKVTANRFITKVEELATRYRETWSEADLTKLAKRLRDLASELDDEKAEKAKAG